MRHHDTHLYLLIQRLSVSEKRHFHRLAHLHRTAAPDYYCYFESLRQLGQWTPEREREAVKDAAYADKLPVVKRQLFEKLLYALDDLHRKQDPEERVKALLHEAYLLLKKDLPIAAERRLKKAKKTIGQHGYFHLWPAYQRTLMLLQEQQLRRRQLRHDMTEFPENWPAQQLELRTQLSNQYRKLKAYAASFGNLSGKVTELPLPAEPPAHPAGLADHLQTEALLAFAAGHPEQAKAHNQQLLNVLQQLDRRSKTIPERTLSTSYNLLLDYLHLGLYDELEAGLNELRKLPTKVAFRQLPRINARVFEWGFQLELNVYLRRRQWTMGRSRLSELAEGISRYQQNLSGPGFASLHHLGGLLAFYAKEYSLALDFLQPLYQNQQPAAARDVHRFARYLHLLCHYRLKHFDTASSLLSSLRRLPEHLKGPSEVDFGEWMARLLRHPHNEQAILREWKMAYNTDSEVERYLCLSAWFQA